MFSMRLRKRLDGKAYNWETATYGKIIYVDDINDLSFFEKKLPAIVYDDALTSELEFSSEPTVSPQHVDEVNWKIETSLSESDDEKYEIIYDNDLLSYKIFLVNDLKLDMGNDDNKIDIKKYLGDISIEPLHSDTAYPVTWIRRINFLYGYSSVGRFDVFLCNQLLVFQQHQDESLYDSWTRFKDVIQKVPNHGLSIWTLIEIFVKHLDSLSRHIINLIAEGDLRKFSDIGAWVQVPGCMAWLNYGEHVDSISTMDNKVGVTSPESTTQTLLSFEEYTPPMTYPEEVEKTLVTRIEIEPLNETKLKEVGLNCNHNTPLSSREVPSFDGPKPQPLLNGPFLDVSLGDVIGPKPPIKPHSPDSSRMKVVDYLTTQTPPSPHVANSQPKGVYSYYNPCINDPKRKYEFKPGLLGKSVSLGVDISIWEMFDDDWGLESKEVSPLEEELNLFDRPNEVERGRILEAHRLEPILQQQISQRMAPSHHDGMLYLMRRSLEDLRMFSLDDSWRTI
ncbi:hypothetical protein Tco_1408490 [Tanacetum coccineum]